MNNIVSLFDKAPIVERGVSVEEKGAIAFAVSGDGDTVGSDYAGAEQKLFTVESAPIEGPYGVIPNKQGLFVDEKNINIVSDRYEIHQPKEIYNTFERVADKTGLEITNTLTNPHNGGLMINAKFNDCQLLGEDHDINLVFYTSHCGKYRTFLTLNLLRIACFNQVPCLYQDKDRFIIAEKHYKNALNIDLVAKSLENIPASVEAYNIKAQALKDKQFSETDFVDWYKGQLKLDETSPRYDNKIRNIINTYRNAPGQALAGANNAYKAFQAVTYMNTHEGRNTAMKAENTLIKGGNDSLKALDSLLAVA